MKVSREIKKEEAIKRMKELGIISDAVKQFKNDDVVMVSEPSFGFGALYWLDSKLKEEVVKFEKENNALVYMVVRAYTTLGKMDSYLFISDYEEEWEMDNEDIKEGIVMSYTVNYNMPDCSEFGSVGVKSAGGGLFKNMVNVKKDLTGMVFDKLTVLRQAEDYIKPDGRREAQWLCECSCDEHNQVKVTTSHLRSKHTTSCGCARVQIAKENGSVCKKYNKYNLSEEYGIGWTTNTNKEFYFDLEDYDKIKDYCWREDAYGYIETTVHNNGESKGVKMHNVILGELGIDHITRNKNDNRKENLRLANQSINSMNRTIASNNTSGFIGVSWNKQRGKWSAYIKKDGKQIYLGSFINKEDAIITRLKAEKEYFGDISSQRHLFEEYGIN